MNGIDELAALIVRLQTADLAAATLDKLCLHVADTIGAWIAATRTPEGNLLLAFRRRQPAAGDTSADDLATCCALTRLSELDDIHLASMTTPGSIVIPAAMTLAATLPDADVGGVAAAMLAGYEAMVRLGLALKGPNILYRGIWPTYFGAGFATAAVAARLLHLDEAQTAHALALALNMAAPAVGQHHAATTARWFLAGNAAREGFIAAYAAQAGFTADTDVLRSRLFPDVYGVEPDIAAMSEPNAAVALAHVSFKPWCAARQTMAATQALREILDGGVAAAEISEITAHVPPPHLKMIDHGIHPGNRASFLTSLPYQMAMMALHPDAMLGLGEPAVQSLPALQSLMARVRITADDALLTDYPSAWLARVVVTTPSGRHERRVRDVPGDPGRPFAEADVRNKFLHNVGSVLGGDSAEPLWRSSMSVLRSRQSLLSTMQDLTRVMAI
ncbi:MAG: MmgE/PrpD family protein [Xanthobacteraceae bacterium]|jgi:2-methylcitrate dehydratase PrpD